MRELSHAARDYLREVRRRGRQRFFTASVNRDGNLKVPLGVFFEAVRHAPRGCRIKLLQRLLSRPAPPAARAEVCEINSLVDFESAYPRLAAILGHAGKTPPPGELEFLQSVGIRPSRYEGRIGISDYLFLTAFISILAPRRVVEIGTLTGFSAAIIAAALQRQHGSEGASWVDTIDIRSQCLIDEARPTGCEIAESFPELVGMIRLHAPHDSEVVKELAKRSELEIAFIDARHSHPMPLLDVLRLAPYVRSGGWIVLHDIQLGTIGRKAIEAGQTMRWKAGFGAEWFFQYWPFKKISGGNIGAVQLPNDKSALVQFASRLMALPFEIGSEDRARRELYQSFAELI